ncbi:MAG: hypothetical protein JOS17DRAFT_766892, partial [Linnemannia elongata]
VHAPPSFTITLVLFASFLTPHPRSCVFLCFVFCSLSPCCMLKLAFHALLLRSSIDASSLILVCFLFICPLRLVN